MTGPNRHYVLAAGGTGGHLTPAFALAHVLERRGHHVALITDERGAAIPGKPDFLPAHVLPAGRFGKNPLSWFKGAKAVLQGRRMALRLFESFEPSAIVGFGGYPALPALLAARRAEIPSVIHEQNAVLGRVNRLEDPHREHLARVLSLWILLMIPVGLPLLYFIEGLVAHVGVALTGGASRSIGASRGGIDSKVGCG